MSTAARKARKRAGIPFVKSAKVVTPLHERLAFWALHPGLHGTKHFGDPMPRSAKKQQREILARTDATR